MKLGAWIDAGLRPAQVVEIARRLEQQWRDDERSVESVWISEAYIGWDPITLAALTLQNTTRLRIGTAIVNPYTRHPAVLAMTALTMNEVGPGRFVLGIGTGEPQWMRALGYPFTKPLSLMREAGRQIRQIMRGERVESKGDRVQLIIRNVDPDVPLHLAAVGPRMCDLAGREFDGCVLPIATPVLARRAIEDVRGGTRARGGGEGSCETVATLLFAAGGDADTNRARLRRKLGLMLMGSGAASLLERNGVDPEHAGRFHEHIAADGLQRALDQLPDELVEAFCLYGDLDRCWERLGAYRDTGLDVAALLCEADQVGNLVALARRTGDRPA